MSSSKQRKKPPRRMSNLKKERKYAAARKKGELQGEDEFKRTKKGIMWEVYNHIGKAVDRIDPLKAIAIVGLTPIVKMILETTYKTTMQTIFSTAPSILSLGLWDIFGGVPWLGISKETVEAKKEELGEIVPDWAWWIVAFALSYIIVEHGGSLLGLTEKGLSPIVGMLIGAA